MDVVRMFLQVRMGTVLVPDDHMTDAVRQAMAPTNDQVMVYRINPSVQQQTMPQAVRNAWVAGGSSPGTEAMQAHVSVVTSCFKRRQACTDRNLVFLLHRGGMPADVMEA